MLIKTYFLNTLSRDGRIQPGNEILMVDGKSLVGLTHAEAVNVLKLTQPLVQLVIATEVGWEQGEKGGGKKIAWYVTITINF